MKVRQAIALALSPDLRSVARDARDALRSVQSAYRRTVPEMKDLALEDAIESLRKVLDALEGRRDNPG